MLTLAAPLTRGPKFYTRSYESSSMDSAPMLTLAASLTREPKLYTSWYESATMDCPNGSIHEIIKARHRAGQLIGGIEVPYKLVTGRWVSSGTAQLKQKDTLLEIGIHFFFFL